MFTYRVDPTGFRTLSGSLSCAVGDTVTYFLFYFPCLPGKGRVGGERGDICMKAVGNSWADILYVILGHKYSQNHLNRVI